jgi:phosphatidylcholine synthase
VGVFVLAALSFTPVRFLHPFRVKHWRPFNVALLAVWAVLAFLAVAANLSPGPYITIPLSIIAIYFFVVGLLRPSA